MSKNILLISELKNKKFLTIEELMKKCYIDDVNSLLTALFKIFNKEIDHVTGYTVFSDKNYLVRIFEYINVIIREEKCDLLKIKTYLDLASSKIEIKFKQCSKDKYTRFFNKIYNNIEKSRLYIVDKTQEKNNMIASENGIEEVFKKIDMFISTLTPSKTFNPNYEEYEKRYNIIFKNILSDNNVDEEEIIDKLEDLITKIEDKKLVIKGIPHSRRVKRFLNHLKLVFDGIIYKYKKPKNKSYKYTN